MQNVDHTRYCIQVPYAGSRVFEVGDEEFLRIAFDSKGEHFYALDSTDMTVFTACSARSGRFHEIRQVGQSRGGEPK
jgi:hypothetical protein